MNKENVSRLIGIRVPPSLYNEFELRCQEHYKTVSETIRELIVQYVKSVNLKPANQTNHTSRIYLTNQTSKLYL